MKPHDETLSKIENEIDNQLSSFIVDSVERPIITENPTSSSGNTENENVGYYKSGKKKGQPKPRKQNTEQAGNSFDVEFSNALADLIFNTVSLVTGKEQWQLEEKEMKMISNPLNIVVNKYLKNAENAPEYLLGIALIGIVGSKVKKIYY